MSSNLMIGVSFDDASSARQPLFSYENWSAEQIVEGIRRLLAGEAMQIWDLHALEGALRDYRRARNDDINSDLGPKLGLNILPRYQSMRMTERRALVEALKAYLRLDIGRATELLGQERCERLEAIYDRFVDEAASAAPGAAGAAGAARESAGEWMLTTWYIAKDVISAVGIIVIVAIGGLGLHAYLSYQAPPDRKHDGLPELSPEAGPDPFRAYEVGPEDKSAQPQDKLTPPPN